MDLYGDLPPTSDGVTPVAANLSGWSQPALTITSKVATVVVEKQIATEVTKTKIPGYINPTKTASKPVSSLAFKPRQTAPSTAKSTSTNLPAQNSQFATTATTTILPLSSQNIESDAPTVTLNDTSEDKENEDLPVDEFNSNSSFDVEDPYDPKKPNDYMAYCEERLENKRLQRLEVENRKQIEEQTRIREENAKLRQAAAQSGDYSALLNNSINVSGGGGGRTGRSNFSDTPDGYLQSSPRETSNFSDSVPMAAPVGRGRGGRGAAVNLPAWMTKQMEEGTLAAQSVPGLTSADTSPSNKQQNKDTQRGASGQFDDVSHSSNSDAKPAPATSSSIASVIGMKRKAGGMNKPSCVVLLKNMVAPSDVDDFLAQETKNECLKFGEVKDCVVSEVPYRDKITGIQCPDEERVRIFVAFEKQESAVKAYRDLNGRYFGGRQITASFYDEDKYNNKDFAPNMGEW